MSHVIGFDSGSAASKRPIVNFLRLLHVNSMNSRYRMTFRGACSPLADNIWLNVLEKSLCSEVPIKDYAVIGDSWVRSNQGAVFVLVPQALDILQTDVNLRARRTYDHAARASTASGYRQAA